jgi:hypothetical protein
VGAHGCVIPGRGCQALQELERLYQQSPTAAIILGGLIAVTVCVAVLWLLDLRGKTNWKPHTEYEPPRMERRDQDQ